MDYKLSDYPLFIEPTEEVLEATGKAGSDERALVRLQRVPTHVVLTRLSGLPAGLVHFFGLSERFEQNKFLVAYSSCGYLRSVLSRVSENDWHISDIPIEHTGEGVRLPSVRLVFKTERARAVFIHHVEQIVKQKVVNPTLLQVLTQLAEPVRTLNVWRHRE